MNNLKPLYEKYNLDYNNYQWLTKIVNDLLYTTDYSQNGFHSPTSMMPINDINSFKKQNIKMIFELASSIQINDVEIINIDNPHAYYMELVNYDDNNDIFDPGQIGNINSVYKTYNTDTFTVKSSTNNLGTRTVKHDFSITETHKHIDNFQLNRILIQEMSNILNKKLLNAKKMFIYKFGELFVTNSLSFQDEYIFSCRVAFDY